MATKDQKGKEKEEEEIVMSSTAYPGQEWTPELVGVHLELGQQ